MRLETYEAIRREIAATPCDAHPNVDALRAAHPELTLDALVSIASQESSRRIRAAHGRQVRAIEAHARRYLLGEDVFSVAQNLDFPACQLMRLLLEHLLGVGHKAVGALLRDPHGKIPATPAAGTPAAARRLAAGPAREASAEALWRKPRARAAETSASVASDGVTSRSVDASCWRRTAS